MIVTSLPNSHKSNHRFINYLDYTMEPYNSQAKINTFFKNVCFMTYMEMKLASLMRLSVEMKVLSIMREPVSSNWRVTSFNNALAHQLEGERDR
jgi:hypothetical protein